MSNMEEVQKRRRAAADAANALPIKDHDKRQKYPRGSRCKIADVMPSMQAHFEAGCECIIQYSYAQKFWGEDFASYSILKLDKNGKEKGTSAWYYEPQLTLVSDDLEAGLKILEEYKQRRASETT